VELAFVTSFHLFLIDSFCVLSVQPLDKFKDNKVSFPVWFCSQWEL